MAERRVLVTGSTQGIGLAIARCFAQAADRVAVHGLGTEAEFAAALETLKLAGASEVRRVKGDLSQPDEIDTMMDDLEHWGGLDILVNNAGIQHPAPIDGLDCRTWDRIVAVNLSAAFHTMRRALPSMAKRGYGRVINIASVHGLVGSVAKAPYVAAKHGLVGLSKVAALEYAHSGSAASGGVTVNCICPGWTETSLMVPQIEARADLLGCNREGAIADLLSEKQPSRRVSDPAEIGSLAVWLSERAAHNVTGAAIPVDGAWTAQ